MKTVAISMFIVIIGWITWSYFAGRNLESPQYRIVSQTKIYEIREYPTYLTAEVTVNMTGSSGSNNAFSILADYIFGNNLSQKSVPMTTPVTITQATSEKIAMTTPVTTTQSNNSLTMGFIFPAQYRKETAPRPNTDQITIREVPAKKYSAIRFTGWATNKKRLKQTEKLITALNADQITIIGKPELLQYDQPGKFPWFRRNEIRIEVE